MEFKVLLKLCCFFFPINLKKSKLPPIYSSVSHMSTLAPHPCKFAEVCFHFIPTALTSLDNMGPSSLEVTEKYIVGIFEMLRSIAYIQTNLLNA